MNSNGLVADWRALTTKAARTQLVRATLAAAPVGMVPRISELYGLCEALVDAHPQAARKREGGIVGFEVRRWGKSSELVVHYADGMEEGISWLKCCGAVTERSEIRNAYREAVDDQIAPLRRPGMHVDHVAPWTFARLVELFEAEHGVATMADVEPDPRKFAGTSAQERSRLREPRRSLFADYHRARAVLEAVSPAENYARARRPLAPLHGNTERAG